MTHRQRSKIYSTVAIRDTKVKYDASSDRSRDPPHRVRIRL